MKFCYVDETGIGGEPIAVMAGIVVDAHRMHLTKTHWGELLDVLSNIVGQRINEFHTHKFYGGKGIWKQIDGPQRAEIITAVINWMAARKHKVVYSAVLVSALNEQIDEGDGILSDFTLWRTLGFHLALALQRAHQGESKTKGHTVLVFDEEVHEKSEYTSLLLSPPDWSDEYYNRGKKQNPLDQLIDVPHFVDSEKVELVQVADLYAFILRRHFEMASGLEEPKYADEEEKISEWSSAILKQTISNANLISPETQQRAVGIRASACCDWRAG